MSDKNLVIKTANVTKEQDEYIKNSALNFSKFVRQKIEEHRKSREEE